MHLRGRTFNSRPELICFKRVGSKDTYALETVPAPDPACSPLQGGYMNEYLFTTSHLDQIGRVMRPGAGRTR